MELIRETDQLIKDIDNYPIPATKWELVNNLLDKEFSLQWPACSINNSDLHRAIHQWSVMLNHNNQVALDVYYWICSKSTKFNWVTIYELSDEYYYVRYNWKNKKYIIDGQDGLKQFIEQLNNDLNEEIKNSN